jgi:tetratricopeptide (TPR) repeat protein
MHGLVRHQRWGWAVIAGLALIVAGAAGWIGWKGKDPGRLRARIEAEVAAGRWEPAEAAIARLERRQALTTADRMLKARIAAARGRFDEALAALEHVGDEDPQAVPARLMEGQIALKAHRLRAAEAAARRALQLDPNRNEARFLLIYADTLRMHREEFKEQFRVLAQRVPLGFDHVLLWCQGRMSFWDPEKATAALEQFLATDPDDRLLRLAWAEGLRRLGRVAEAESALAVLPRSDPDAQAARARLALECRDVRAAEALVAQGPEDHPGLARLRGRLALLRHDATAAVRHYQAAFAAEPDHPDAARGLGQALTLAGNAAAAVPYLDLAKRQAALSSLLQRAASSPHSRDDPKLLRDLGAACEALGYRPEARAWYQLAIARNPLDPDAQHALYRLAPRDPTDQNAKSEGLAHP